MLLGWEVEKAVPVTLRALILAVFIFCSCYHSLRMIHLMFLPASMTVVLCSSVTVYPPLPQILDRGGPPTSSYSTKKTLLEISSVQAAACGEEVKRDWGEGEGVKTCFC